MFDDYSGRALDLIQTSLDPLALESEECLEWKNLKNLVRFEFHERLLLEKEYGYCLFSV